MLTSLDRTAIVFQQMLTYIHLRSIVVQLIVFCEHRKVIGRKLRGMQGFFRLAA